MQYISVTKLVSKLIKFNDSNELQSKNIPPISITEEVLKLLKSKDNNDLQ